MRVFIFTILIQIVWTASAHADASYLGAAYTQIVNRRYCGDTDYKDVAKLSADSCRLRKPNQLVSDHPWQIYEYYTFQNAAQEQIDKNNCLKEQVMEMGRNPVHMGHYYTYLAQAWLGMKKAELTLRACRTHALNLMEPADVKRLGKQGAYDKAFFGRNPLVKHPRLPAELLKTCFDPEAMAALEAAQAVFRFTVPVISHPDLIAAMDAHRNIITKANGKPVTDEEILNMELPKDMATLTLDDTNEPFQKDVVAVIEDLTKERMEMTARIAATKKNGHFELNQEMKDYMYDDETVINMLKAKNEIRSDFRAINNKQGFQYPEEQISNGAFCVMAKYKPTVRGELAGLAVESLVSGGIIFRALNYSAKAIKAADEVGKVSTARARMNRVKAEWELSKQALGMGAIAPGLRMIQDNIRKACPVPGGIEGHKMQKVESANKHFLDASVTASQIPKALGYSTWGFEFDPKHTPSCKNEDSKNLMLNQGRRSNCALEALLLLAPLKAKYVLPPAIKIGD